MLGVLAAISLVGLGFLAGLMSELRAHPGGAGLAVPALELPEAAPDGVRILTPRDAYPPPELPSHLCIVGSGVTGLVSTPPAPPVAVQAAELLGSLPKRLRRGI